MTVPMARFVAEAGCPATGFRARQLTDDLVRAANLVLTATREHRSAVVDLLPAAVRRTFTLREFARLLAGADLGSLPGSTALRLTSAIAYALTQRGRVQASSEDDGVVDPFGAPDSVYAESFRSIRSAVTDISRAVGSGASPVAPSALTAR
jgi:protein-tyrosine phosphatase